MHYYLGMIVEESLRDTEVLDAVKIISSRTEQVTERHQTPWLSVWTIDEVRIPITQAKFFARDLSHAIDPGHADFWVIDFKNNSHHYIIFKDRVFCVDRSSPDQYEAACMYGRSIGVPPGSVRFCPGS